MSVKRRILAGGSSLLAIAAVGGGAWWIVTTKPTETKLKSASVPAAAVHAVKEDELGIVKLSPEAQLRLGVQTAAVERRTVKRVRVYGGEVIVPAGRTILVAAPLGGTLQAPDGGVPNTGSKVRKGQHVFYLRPLLPPEASTTFAASRADVEGQVKNAETQLAVMKLALDRAQRLFREEAGSKRGVEEAQAQHDLALKSLEATNSRLAVLTKAVEDAVSGKATPLPIEAPEDGLLRNVSALPGQNVPLGGALFEVVDLSRVWIRVAVFVGDLDDIAKQHPAEVGRLNVQPGDRVWPAPPVQAPPSANPLAATVDLYYALENPTEEFTPGQRVGVTLPLKSSNESLTLPWSAVVHDLQGGTWVYQEKSPGVYQRQRVLMRYVVEGTAVVASGPAPGTSVVTEGAEELFGAETGFSK